MGSVAAATRADANQTTGSVPRFFRSGVAVAILIYFATTVSSTGARSPRDWGL